MPSTSAISAAVIRRRRRRSIASILSAGVFEGTCLGAEERSAIDSPRRRRATHLATVRLLTPAASAARAWLHPCSITRLESSSREFGQVVALASRFIRCSSLVLVVSTPPASKEARMNNVLRSYSGSRVGTWASPSSAPEAFDLIAR